MPACPVPSSPAPESSHEAAREPTPCGTDRSRGGSRRSLLAGAAGLVLAATTLPLVPTTAARPRRRRRRAPLWELTFADEFGGAQLDAQRWETQFPWGRDRSSVGELQYYAPEAARVEGGLLRLEAQRTEELPSHAFTSGLISSHRSFAQQYGRFAIRCRMPPGKGFFPAFWLLPTDTSWPPEIDVVEALGDTPQVVYMNVHWDASGQDRSDQAQLVGRTFASAFHTYTVDWTATDLVWFVDGIERHRVSGHSPRGPMYLIANLAIGGGWAGPPNDATRFPSALEVDWIRAWRRLPRV